MHQQSDGYRKEFGTGKRLGRTNSENYGVSILFTPTGNFDALLTLERQEQDFKNHFASTTQPGDAFCTFVPAGACGRKLTDDYSQARIRSVATVPRQRRWR